MATPFKNLRDNMKDVIRLLEIHERIGGQQRGRRYGMEVLNKSAVVLACANWESFIEDVAKQAMNHVIDNADNWKRLPKLVTQEIAKRLKNDKHELSVWNLAGLGWKKVVRDYRDQVIREELRPFNTPRTSNIDKLFEKLLGIADIRKSWCWQKMSRRKASEYLDEFVRRRGTIAHKGSLDQSVTKAYVEQRVLFLLRLAVKTSNSLWEEVLLMVDSAPWEEHSFDDIPGM